MRKNTEQKQVILQLVILLIFSAAFGYVEGSVAHYLRLHYYPAGFNFELSKIDSHTLFVELGREIATIVMLASIAVIAGGGKLVKFAKFVYIFAVWDITYYVSLYVFEGWPKSLLDWDVLFLVPLPWFAPVAAPVMISILGIIWAITVIIEVKDTEPNLFSVIAVAAGLVLSFISFVIDSPANVFPQKYHWELLSAGLISIAGGYIYFLVKNFSGKEVKKHEKRKYERWLS